MGNILGGLFVFLNLFIRVPVRIALHFKPNNARLMHVDLIAFIATGINAGAICIYAYVTKAISLGLCLTLSILFLGFSFWLIYLAEKKKKDEKLYWENIYKQTMQKPDRDDYGRCKENPIWAGTPLFYFNHIYTLDGNFVSWKLRQRVELEKKNGCSHMNGFLACEMAEYDIFVKGKHVDTFFVCTKGGLDKMKIWHAPKGYKFVEDQ